VPGPKMKESRAGHTATLLRDGRVLIAGGHDDSAEIYDPTARRFVAFLHMGVSRFDHSATLLPDGKVLIAGGFWPAYKALASAEIYDPSNNQFKTIPDLAQ